MHVAQHGQVGRGDGRRVRPALAAEVQVDGLAARHPGGAGGVGDRAR